MKTVIFLIGRIIVGLYFLFNASLHLFLSTEEVAGYAAFRGLPISNTWVYLTGLLMLVGGLCILLGFLPHIGSLPLVIFLLVTAFAIHHFWTDTDPALQINEIFFFSRNLGLVGLLLMTVMTPDPWPASLGKRLGISIKIF